MSGILSTKSTVKFTQANSKDIHSELTLGRGSNLNYTGNVHSIRSHFLDSEFILYPIQPWHYKIPKNQDGLCMI